MEWATTRYQNLRSNIYGKLTATIAEPAERIPTPVQTTAGLPRAADDTEVRRAANPFHADTVRWPGG